MKNSNGMKPVIVSGIQPTGKLHLGNYLGALKHFVELQNSGEYTCYFFIADLHSITTDFSAKEKREQIMEIALDYLAAGLTEPSIIFQQSAISAHSELTWLLNTIAPMGELARMTQFKAKAFKDLLDKKIEIKSFGDHLEIGGENVNSVDEAYAKYPNVGLFDYPVLMAADILLYDAKAVPVGDDQLQHLELTRTLARKFNAKFGKIFYEPKPLMTSVPRLMSLDDPEKKMSKSRPAGCVFIDDEPSIIRKKVMSAVTDSESTVAYDVERRPAVANLLELYSAMSGQKINDIVKEYKGKGYADFKKGLAETIIAELAPFQQKKKELMKDIPAVEAVLRHGAAAAREIAEEKLLMAKRKMGLEK